MTRIRLSVAALAATASLAACSAERVVDNTVDAGLFAGRTVVKTGVGAGKMVVKGGRALATDE